MGTLTVRENLMFSANLRIPESAKLAEREQIVEDAIRELGLERCADTKVFNFFSFFNSSFNLMC
jgi:ATP-binding cassette subfamily G (WHITE) protein 2